MRHGDGRLLCGDCACVVQLTPGSFGGKAGLFGGKSGLQSLKGVPGLPVQAHITCCCYVVHSP
jgi:hypothetical protein